MLQATMTTNPEASIEMPNDPAFPLYPEYKIDHRIISYRSDLAGDDYGYSEHMIARPADLGEVRELLRQRARQLGVGGEETSHQLYEIYKQWQAGYLRPRVMPLPERSYRDWIVSLLHRGCNLAFAERSYAYPTGATAAKLALADLRLPPLYGSAGEKIMVPPTVNIEAAAGLGHSVLMMWGTDRPLVSNQNWEHAIELYKGMALRLHLEDGVPEELLPMIEYPTESA
jgi:hypothetical protein